MPEAPDSAVVHNELHNVLSALLTSQKLAVLATHRDGQPYCNLVGIAATDDLKYVFFATPRSTRKYDNMTRDARVALLLDSRSAGDVDFKGAVATTILGCAEEMPKSDTNSLLKLYIDKHPHLRDFVLSPDCAFVRVTVSKYIVVRRFRDIEVLQIAQ